MIEILKTKNCKRYEIIIRLDYSIGKDGSILPPALRDPPEFKVSPYRSCFEDSRRDRWCDDQLCKMFKEEMDTSLQHQGNRDQLLYFFVRSRDDKVAIHNVNATIDNVFCNLFTEDTLEAARLVFEEDNYIPLFKLKCFVDHHDNLLQMLCILNQGSVCSPGFLYAMNQAMNQCPEFRVVFLKEQASLQSLLSCFFLSGTRNHLRGNFNHFTFIH